MWQDIVLTITNLIFMFSMISAVLDKQKPPLSTSVPSVVALAIICFVQIDLKLYFTTVVTFILTCLWLTVAIQRFKQGKVIIKQVKS